jgi:hypothetical protein
MILNARNNMFLIHFDKSFFYEEIYKKWNPVVKRLKLPYEDMSDFITACIQSISFPSVDLQPVEQQQEQFRIAYRSGKELEPVFDKNLTITFKLSEGFICYWILFEQIEQFLNYSQTNPFWSPLYISFLDNNGFELVIFEFNKIIPLNLSQFQVSYATTAAEFNTFTMGLRYNRFRIKRRVDDDNYDIIESKE